MSSKKMGLFLLFFFLMSFFLVSTACHKKASSHYDPAYKVLKREVIKAIGSEVVELEHIQSGAHVVLVVNKDQARSFMVGFRTPPYDDTGLFHIFEHSVLEGSRLYPSKSNFFHLANSSVASFINAMTGPVDTTYPFVTRSPKDFHNLLSVYMDAVFFPKAIRDERIIKREGWRYEVDPKTRQMSINGIVLNEMKGAFSSPYQWLWREVSRALVPQTPFAFSSGGLPEKVATLSFSQIKEAHKKYYHPQNALIYLYGDIDYAKTLETMDRQFLKEFHKTPGYKKPAIPLQEDFNYASPLVKKTYPGKRGAHKDFISKGFILGSELSPLEERAASVLAHVLVKKDSSPLKLRFLKEGLARDLFTMSVGGEENAVAFVFEGANLKQLKKIKQVLKEEIDQVVTNGLDPEWLTGVLNKYEFSYKEKNFNGSHRGLQLSSVVLNNWLYQDEPLGEALDFVKQFKDLREKLSDQEFIKSFVRQAFQENPRTRWVALRPDPQFSKKFNAGLDRQIKEALKLKPLSQYKKEDDAYREWVAMKEGEEVLSKTPLLSLSDIQWDEAPVSFSKTKLGKAPLLLYPQKTSGISYVNLFFDLQGVPEKNLKNLPFFTSFIQRTNSRKKSFQEIERALDAHVGGLRFGVSTYQSFKRPSQYRPTLKVSLSFLDENRAQSMELLGLLMKEARFEPQDRLQSLLGEFKINRISGVSDRASGLSRMAATRSFFPLQGAFEDEVMGGSFENYSLNTKINGKNLMGQLQAMLPQIFNQKRLYLGSITADPESLLPIKTDLESLLTSLPKTDSGNQKWLFKSQKAYDAYAIPGEVQYLTQATSYKDHGLDYHGAMKVYTGYLDNHYMIPKLREQGGAYGAGSALSPYGIFRLSSYQDPHLAKTHQAFSEALEFMQKEKFTAPKLKPAILGALQPYYRDKSIHQKTQTMTNLYLMDQTWADYMKIKKQIMETTPEKIHQITEALLKSFPHSKKAVAGNPKKIEKEGQFFKNILSLQ